MSVEIDRRMGEEGNTKMYKRTVRNIREVEKMTPQKKVGTAAIITGAATRLVLLNI